jgi:hypothetical protein
MATVNLLIGNSEPRVSNLIEALVRDVCGQKAQLECTRAPRADDLIILGCQREFDLIILIPDNLQPDPALPYPLDPAAAAARAIVNIRNQSAAPIIAAAVFAQYESILLEAGADRVLELPFNCAALKDTVRDILQLPEVVEPVPVATTPVDRSFASTLLRGWQRLTAA